MTTRAMPDDAHAAHRPSGRTVALAAGIGVTAALVAREWSVMRSKSEGGQRALVSYLDDHLSGADAAIQVVERLRRTLESADDRRFFESFHEELLQDRDVVKALLARLGSSSKSSKRLASHAAAAIAKLTAGGRHGKLSLFLTLESLSIGIQGKRCLWRALQGMPHLTAPGARTFEDLEASALRQWDAIEERRHSLVHDTFTAVSPRPGTAAGRRAELLESRS